MHHLVFGQLDPTRHTVGGIPGFVRDLVQFAPQSETFSIVGVASDRSEPLGVWRSVTVGKRAVQFMAVARLDPSDQQRRIPHSARFLAGVVRFRPRADHAVVHSHRAEIGAALAVLLRDAVRVQFLHGDGRAALSHGTETFWRFFPRGYAAVESFAVRRSAQTVVMSSSAHQRLQMESEHVVLGRNWFDGSRFYPAERVNGDEIRIGWAGRFEPPKDPIRAVGVFRALRAHGVRFSAWMAGSGTLERPTRRALSEGGLESMVELVGILDPDQLADELRRSTVFLMTSLWEGFPRMAVEALASGVPVVSTDAGEMKTLIEDGTNGFIAVSREPAELRDLVVRATLLERSCVAETVDHLEARTVVPDILGGLPSSS